MAYDEKLDVVLAEFNDLDGMEVKLVKYNGGEPKVQLSRFTSDSTGKKMYLKVGRLSLDEVAILADEAFPKLLAAAKGRGGKAPAPTPAPAARTPAKPRAARKTARSVPKHGNAAVRW